MATGILNNPSPDVLINSMRSIGYSFKTAVADIIDNSISAYATDIHIYSPIDNDDIFIAFFDNGIGMTRDELLNAMKYGSIKDGYTSTDLGRFGLGLKTASLSQCKRLTVVSKKDNLLSAFSWDLDHVQDNKVWECLELDTKDIDKLPKIEKIKDCSIKHGTLVVWENFDILFAKSNGKLYEIISTEVEETEKHLSLIFHRFINRKTNKVNIYINNDKIVGCDPFLEDHKKTDTSNEITIDCCGSKVKVQPYVIPHANDLSNDDIEKLGGLQSLRNGQGFYIYRNNRLIVYGTWFRLSSSNISTELYKYGRIKVDIPNTLDKERDIDIKKQNANIPSSLLNSLKRLVSQVTDKSKSKSQKRAKLTYDKDNNKIWNKSLTRENKEIFFINTDSEFVKNFINDFGDNERGKIIRFLDIISDLLPYMDIYNSMCNNNVNQTIDLDHIDSYVLEGVHQFKWLKNYLQKSDEEIFEKLKTYEPFNNDELFNLVKVRINNEN